MGVVHRNVDHRGDHSVLVKTGVTCELQPLCPRENTVLLSRGDEGFVSYNLNAANNCVISAQGKGTYEIDTQLFAKFTQQNQKYLGEKEKDPLPSELGTRHSKHRV